MSDDFLTPTYACRDMEEAISKYRLPERSTEPRVAYQLCKDELKLDGKPSLNLASFVTTWMEPEAEQLIMESLNKNLADHDEYPSCVEFELRCVNMLAHLFHANLGERDNAIGTSTVGSSEAIMLAGLAMKHMWRQHRRENNKPCDKPNIVMGINVQVVWEKFANYFDVEPRYVPMTENRFILDVDEAIKLVDENTIGVVAILGSTFTGEYEPVEALDAALQKLNAEKQWGVGIHVDAASGGFVAPFAQSDLLWDFQLPLVRSINVSGHKYGLVYPGIGWILWRDPSVLPKELIYDVNYLGGDMPTFNLNFSRPAAFVIAQYYNFLRLGVSGYQKIAKALMVNASYLSHFIGENPEFELLSKDHNLPVVTWRLRSTDQYTVFDLSNKLREYGWMVPAYTLPKNAEHIAVLRVVVREGLSKSLIDDLCDDIAQSLVALKKMEGGGVPGHGAKIC